MSYCYDVMSKVWAHLQSKLPSEIRDSETAERFGFLLEEMHEANHRLGDAMNRDHLVSKKAAKLENIYLQERA